MFLSLSYLDPTLWLLRGWLLILLTQDLKRSPGEHHTSGSGSHDRMLQGLMGLPLPLDCKLLEGLCILGPK